MTEKTDRRSLLQKRKEQIEKQLAAIDQREKGKARKEDTRLKVLIGAAYLNDTEKHPETRGGVIEVLKRGITTDRDREFLKSKGWL